MKKPTAKALRNDPRYIKGINFTGNKKLKNTAAVRFAIWNIPARVTCPYRCPMCSAACYAYKAEKQYPSCRDRRAMNWEVTKAPDFAERMIYTIGVELDTPKCRKVTANGGKVVFRIHESGDFYNLAYAMAWVKIAKAFETDDRVVFLAYTKSLPYIRACGYGTPDFPSNLVIRSSVWADTAPEMLELTNALNLPIYTALTLAEMDEKERNGEKFTRCRCSDCATCGKCWDKSEKTIICEIH